MNRTLGLILLGLLSAAIPVGIVTDKLLYSALYVPAATEEVRESVRASIDRNALVQAEQRTWFAPDVIADVCDQAVYYGCLDWEQFSGSSSILTNVRGAPNDAYGLELFRACPSARNCKAIPEYNAFGVVMSRQELFSLLESAETVETCDPYARWFWHLYQAEICKRATSLFGIVTAEQYLVKFDNAFIDRVVGSYPEEYHALLTVNYGTRQIYEP